MSRADRRFRPTLGATPLETRCVPSGGTTTPTDPAPVSGQVNADAHAEVLNNPLFTPSGHSGQNPLNTV